MKGKVAVRVHFIYCELLAVALKSTTIVLMLAVGDKKILRFSR